MWLTVAQIVDPVSGAPAWVGTGLLGAVLAWLLFRHLPAKDAQLKEFNRDKDLHMQAILDKSDARLQYISNVYEQRSKESSGEFKAALNQILEHCEKETKKLTEAFRTEIRRVANRGEDGE